MEFEDLDYQLLARYLAGECTERERKEVDDWIKADPENGKKLKQFSRIWDLSMQNKRMADDLFDAEKQWQELQDRLRKDEKSVHQSGSEDRVTVSNFRKTSIHSMTQKVARVAAIVLIAGLMGVLAYQNWGQPEPEPKEPVLREISTANAQRANLTLGDGTKVMLNAGSTVKFPDRFEEDIREVFLEGEAYFDVASNPDRPFLIHCRGSVIEVLGTSFSVRSYAEENQVRVVVEEGRVSFSAGESDSENIAIVEAHEMGRYQLGSNRINRSQIEDMQLYMSWLDGYLKFRETSMSKVATELERRYGVEVAFADTVLKDKSLTALLKSRSIRNVLDVITMSLDIDYQLEDNKVIFSN